ncbi:MAG: GNAT family N-acetyltransferase [Polyangiaceae bacterium]|nr:GNAT family N-acetyltransferase [Polyangiaceae bacterium]
MPASSATLSSFEPFPELVTPRLLMRRLGPEDAHELFRLQTDADVNRYLGRAPPTREESDAKLARIEADVVAFAGITWGLVPRGPGAGRAGPAIIGTAGFWRWDKPHAHAELGYLLAPEHWGRGLVSEAVGAIIAFGFERLGLHRIEANVDPANAASLRVLDKLGFVREGFLRENWRFGERFLDTVTFGLLAQDRGPG